MLSRRTFMQSATALGAGTLSGPLWAQDRFDQDALLAFDSVGDITLMHVSDIHGLHHPHFYRPPAADPTRSGAPKVPHLTGEAYRIAYGIGGMTPMDYAHTSENFETLARDTGPIGGLDHVQSVLDAIRGARPGALLLFGGAPDDVSGALMPDVSVSGVSPVPETVVFTRNGTKIAVISLAGKPQARGDLAILCQDAIDQARASGAAVVVGLSQMGIGVDQVLAEAVSGLDVLLSGKDHLVLPEPMQVGDTRIFASGGQGRFVTRIDLDVKDGAIADVQSKAIPVFSDLIRPSAKMTARIAARQDAGDAEALAKATQLLYRRGRLGSPWDDLITAAMMHDQRADAALVPGVRYGVSVLTGDMVTRRDVKSVCGEAAVTVQDMRANEIRDLLEEAAEGAFSGDLYQRTGRDMMRAGGLAYELDPQADKGNRIKELRLLGSDQPLGNDQRLRVARWIDEGPKGMGALLADFLRMNGTSLREEVTSVKIATFN